ncbi:polar amino acid transport system permease protein/cystine transport system permease protein [Faunimonas pinastri]|uniref:Polar amino acid transport system permease protein/cystine transport system permease protein n=1 Tax=Faunimonas pinastri TaxID=1855383 RepID=A0A1H9E734_9HYPH|nr:amino acid ABC transporter permease [Faunimonas pinastri]SEQ21489.1 polar amino acid transport system permease protein/cystine transport system permease protein [Faunimonas pinastri]
MVLHFDILRTVWPALLRGTLVTVELTAAVLVLATPLGILVAELRSIPNAAVRITLGILSGIFRGIPPLLILFFVFFGLPSLGITLESLPSAIVGMTAYMAFYFGEVFRAGLESVPEGQWRAAEALGLSKGRTMFRIILPQTIPAALPPFISHATEVLKGSALAAAVAVPELTHAAKQVFVVTYRPFEILIAAGAIYAVLDSALLVLQLYGERWAARHRAVR